MESQLTDKQRGLTWRVLLIVLLVAPFNCYMLIQMELVRYTFPTWVVPLSNVIFILMGILVINRLIHLFAPSMALRRDELLLFYVMLSLATTLAGGDVLQAVLSVSGHGFWFATEENEWKTLFWSYIPGWLTVDDQKALKGYYLGESSFYLEHHLKVWVPVILAWLALFLLLAFIFLCLNTILRRQWADRERLTFPIIQLPLQMTHPTSGFFRNKGMWLGFAIAGGISLFNGLSTLYPVIPHIPVTRDYYSFLDPPFNLYDGVWLAFYPFAIGIMFLMPLDVLFSTALFYFLYRNELALANVYGFGKLPKFPYQDEQAFGAFLGLCIFFLWVGRHHFSSILKNAFRRETTIDDADEPMPYRTAVWGLVGGLSLFTLALHRAGMSLWIASIFSLLFLITPIITTRIRTEAGIFVHRYHWQAPRYVLNTILGTRGLGPHNLTTLSICFFNRGYRPQQMPHQLEAFKIAEQANISPRRMLAGILIAAGIGIISYFWVQLHLFYEKGAESAYFGGWALRYGREFFERLTNLLHYPTTTDWIGLLFMGVGFGVMGVLTYLRVRFFWLPLHPLGYVMAANQQISDFWIPMLICLFLKWAILKHGGIRSYRRAIPFFLGLVLGDFLMGSIWSFLNVMLNRTMYQFYP